jgi:hypothetical protein
MHLAALEREQDLGRARCEDVERLVREVKRKRSDFGDAARR